MDTIRPQIEVEAAKVLGRILTDKTIQDYLTPQEKAVATVYGERLIEAAIVAEARATLRTLRDTPRGT